MKIEVPVELEPTKYGARIRDIVEIDLNDFEVRKALTDAGLTFPAEKKVEPVEYNEIKGHISTCEGVIVAYKCDNSNFKEERESGYRQLVIQANFAKEFCEEYQKENHPVPGWVVNLYCSLYDNLKGA